MSISPLDIKQKQPRQKVAITIFKMAAPPPQQEDTKTREVVAGTCKMETGAR